MNALKLLRKYRRDVQTGDVYAKWQNSNRRTHAQFINYTGLFVSVLMLWGDRLFVTDVAPFTKARLLSIGIAVLILVFLNRTAPQQVDSRLKQKKNLIESLCLLAPIWIYNYSYHYFVFETANTNFYVYFTGLLLGVGFGAFMLHRFNVEQYLFHIAFIAFSLLELTRVEEGIHDFLYIVIIVHLVSGFVARYFRQDFKSNLSARSHLLSAFVPKQLADHIAVSNDSGSINSQFEAKNRYTVCLCCDWRNYQLITQTYSPEFVNAMTEEYYNRVFEALIRFDPQGQYYANWTADELFIVFFDEDNDKTDVQRRAIEFAFELSTRIFLDVRYDFQFALKYDIGMASGDGYLGLLGPAKLKKTTIVGPSAGTAKRLETEAKTIRRTSVSENPNPIILMDTELFEATKNLRPLSQLSYRPIVATTKDISGQTFYLFQSQFFDVRTLTEEEIA